MHDSPRSMAELIRLERTGRRIKFLFFWGHQPRRDGTIGPECLSQWWPSRFTVDGENFGSAEHYMMWRKALLFGDTEIAAQILAAGHPRQAKMLGRDVRGFNQSVWDTHRYEIVVAGTVAKFGQDERLRRFLIETRKRVLAEASPVDKVWGIGLPADHPHAEQPRRWMGLNLLGFALGEARAIVSDPGR